MITKWISDDFEWISEVVYTHDFGSCGPLAHVCAAWRSARAEVAERGASEWQVQDGTLPATLVAPRQRFGFAAGPRGGLAGCRRTPYRKRSLGAWRGVAGRLLAAEWARLARASHTLIFRARPATRVIVCPRRATPPARPLLWTCSASPPRRGSP